jgi:hypothetical protein
VGAAAPSDPLAARSYFDFLVEPGFFTVPIVSAPSFRQAGSRGVSDTTTENL